MPYLNPAGLSAVPKDIFAVSAAVYSYTHRSVENFFYPTGTIAALGIKEDSSSFATGSIAELPSSVMYFRHLDPAESKIQQKIGISLIISAAIHG